MITRFARRSNHKLKLSVSQEENWKGNQNKISPRETAAIETKGSCILWEEATDRNNNKINQRQMPEKYIAKQDTQRKKPLTETKNL